MRQLPDTYVVTEVACMDYRDNRTFVDKSEYDRLAAEIERLTKERDEARRTVKMAHEEGTRQIATLQARIDELVAERTWQPIETAPKDGTRIIVCAPFGNVWCDVKWEKRPRAGERWTSFIGPLQFCPTHWMPLPRSPEAKP